MRRYHAENKDQLRPKKAAYNHANRARWQEIDAERRLNDPNYRLRKSLRSNLISAVKRDAKRGSAISDIGCTVAELKTYLTAMFRDGMTWGNWRTHWEIDHIRNLTSFDLTQRDQYLAACHYTNLQPLLVDEHRQKSAVERRTPS